MPAIMDYLSQKLLQRGRLHEGTYGIIYDNRNPWSAFYSIQLYFAVNFPLLIPPSPCPPLLSCPHPHSVFSRPPPHSSRSLSLIYSLTCRLLSLLLLSLLRSFPFFCLILHYLGFLLSSPPFTPSLPDLF